MTTIDEARDRYIDALWDEIERLKAEMMYALSARGKECRQESVQDGASPILQQQEAPDGDTDGDAEPKPKREQNLKRPWKGTRKKPGPKPSADPKPKLADAVREVLEKADDALSTEEIFEELAGTGLLSAYGKPRHAIAMTLVKNKDFEKTDDGDWRLA